MRDARDRGEGWSEPVSAIAAAKERFHQVVVAALDDLPEDISRALENVEIVIEDGAPDGNLLGLYHGIPQPDRDGAYTGVLPDIITIYRAPLEARASSDEELAAEVRTTVLHEIAHHFGISDERLRDIDRY